MKKLAPLNFLKNLLQWLLPMDNNLKKEQEEQLKEAETLMTVDAAIKDRIIKIDEKKNEIRPQREMLTSYLENDQAFRETSEVAKKASQQKGSIRKQLLSTPQGQNLTEKLQILKDELIELEDGLSYYLREYQRITGANEFEGQDGELRQIKLTAKLIRKTDLNR